MMAEITKLELICFLIFGGYGAFRFGLDIWNFAEAKKKYWLPFAVCFFIISLIMFRWGGLKCFSDF